MLLKNLNTGDAQSLMLSDLSPFIQNQSNPMLQHVAVAARNGGMHWTARMPHDADAN